MSALTSGTAAVIPSSAERLIRTAEENDWQASALFGAAGLEGPDRGRMGRWAGGVHHRRGGVPAPVLGAWSQGFPVRGQGEQGCTGRCAADGHAVQGCEGSGGGVGGDGPV